MNIDSGTRSIRIQMAHFSNISDRVKDAKNEMDKAQQALHTAYENPILCMRERDVVHKYASTVRAEESFFKQKALTMA
jgi:hypothetical protein